MFSINSGYNTFESIEFTKRPLLHIGQDEIAAGEDLAQKLFELGKRKAACINDESTNEAKASRCTAFEAKFQSLGGTFLASNNVYRAAVETVYGGAGSGTKESNVHDLMQNADVDVLISLSADVALNFNNFNQSASFSTAGIGFATFDIHTAGNEIATMLDNGQLMVAVDQQPFLQGFMPVLFMTTFKTALMKAENTKLKTGPTVLVNAPAIAPYANHDLAFHLTWWCGHLI